jgi:2,4-diaminopentanoate dehydrogenase
VTPLRVVHVGLGPIGIAVADAVAHLPGIEVVGAVDPVLAGRDLGELRGSSPSGLTVAPSLDLALGGRTVELALHCTGSHLAQVEPQLMDLIGRGISVVSTTEELSWPWFHHPAEARRIDEAAQAAGVRVLGTGVNPGFVMDLLPVFMGGVTLRVDAVRVRRVVDASRRRKPLQLKTGAGLTPEAFRARAREGSLGHMGLVESVAMIGAGFGWPIDAIEQTLDPVIAESPVATDAVRVDVGQVRGLHQVATGSVRGERKITLDLTMALGEPSPGDRVTLESVPPLDVHIAGGIHGDVATVGAVAGALPRLHRVAPGLRTVLDLPTGGGARRHD